MTIVPSFEVWEARLSHAPQLPPRLMVGFSCPADLDLVSSGGDFVANLELVDAGLCLHAAPQVDILFRLAQTPPPQEGDLDDVASGEVVVDRAQFLRSLARHRAITVCAFDAQGQAVMALEFNF